MNLKKQMIIKRCLLSMTLVASCGWMPLLFAQNDFGTGDEDQQLQQAMRLRGQKLAANDTGLPDASTWDKVGQNPPMADTQFAPPPPPPMPTASNDFDQSAPPPPNRPPYTGASTAVGDESETEKALNDAAFSAMVKNSFPLSTDQIHRYRQIFVAAQQAAAAAPGTPPRPVATTQIVNLAPGSTPPVVRLAQGFVSSILFVDSTGEPWPIEAYDIGNPSAFNIQWNHKDNTMMIQATTLYTYGNMAVRLRDLSTPVMLTLIPGQQAIDYRIDLRIQAMGPNAKITAMEGVPNAANPVLMSVLDGVPPPGGKLLTVSGGECQAWIVQNRLFVRTRLTILSPGWIAMMNSADGTKAYELQKTPMILASYQGKPIKLMIEGY